MTGIASPDPLSDWIIQATAALAASMADKLLMAIGNRAARPFKEPPRQTALRESLQESLHAAVKELPVTPNFREEILYLFGVFVEREVVIEEFSVLVDARPQHVLNLNTLHAEFLAVGFPVDYVSIAEFEDVIRALVATFYNSAAQRPELQVAIQIQHLHEVAKGVGALQLLAERSAVAAEAGNARLDELVELTRQVAIGTTSMAEFTAVFQAYVRSGPGASLDAYQAITRGLGKDDRTVIIEANGRITIQPGAMAQSVSAAVLDEMRSLLEQARRELSQRDDALDAQELRAREDRYKDALIARFAKLQFQGLSNSVKPISLPLERVYVQLRAVAEVPTAADAFSPEERRVLRMIEEGAKDEDLREAKLRLDALRRERWSKDLLERFPIADVLHDPKRRGLVILGDPGSGKSTLLHFLALMYARGPQDAEKYLEVTGDDANRLPILVPLAAYDAMLPRDLSDPSHGDPTTLAYWHDRLCDLYSESELKDACLKLLVNYEDLPASGRRDKARELVQHLSRRGRLHELEPICARDASGPAPEDRGVLTVREFLVRYYDRRQSLPGLAPVFEQAIASGRALVLLDGMDEVVDESRRKFVAEQISAFVNELIAGGNRVIVTSRIYGYRSAPLASDVPHITVLDFRRDEIELFTRQWCRVLAEWEAGGPPSAQEELKAQEEERDLLNDIRNNPGVEQLAVNPLLLTMLALLRRQVGQLPHRRIELYDQYVRALVQNWEENRSRGARLQAPRRVDVKEAENTLIPLSLWLQQDKPSGTVTEFELLAKLTEFYLADAGESTTTSSPEARQVAERRAESFLHDMRQFSGLLIERGTNAFGFRHLTFQEYFAGRALARMEDEARWVLLKPNLHANRWREPILLAAARLGVTENRGDKATGFVGLVLDAGSDREVPLHRDLFLAADCAADDINVDMPTLRRIVAGLRTLVTSPVPVLATNATQRLSRLAQLKAGEVIRVSEAILGLVEALAVTSEANEDAILNAVYPNWIKAGPEAYVLGDGILTWLERHLSVDCTSAKRHSYYSSHGEMLTRLIRAQPALRSLFVNKLDCKDWFVKHTTWQALTPLLKDYADLRALVVAKLEDEDTSVRWAAVQALTPLLKDYADLRALVVAKLEDEDTFVRRAAVQALSPLVKDDADLRALVVAKLEDEDTFVRRAAVQALSPLVKDDADLRGRLWPVLGSDDQEEQHRIEITLRYRPGSARRALVEAIAELVTTEASIESEVGALLDSPDWRLRLSAAEILASAGEAAINEAEDALVRALDNNLGLDSWPARLRFAEILINHPKYSQEAVATVLPALDYGAHPLVIVRNAADIRKQAALALGKLKAEYRDERVMARLLRLFDEEKEPQVLDGAYNAMLSLVTAPEVETQ